MRINFVILIVAFFIKGFGGKCNDVKVILVGTYAPEPLAPNSNGGNLLAPLLPFLKDFTSILGEEPQMVALDATNPSSPGLKLLRSYLNNARIEFLEVKYYILCKIINLSYLIYNIRRDYLSHHSLTYKEMKIGE